MEAGAIPWTIVAEPGRHVDPAVISVTPERLRRATHGVRRLPAEFPRAVRTVLEDPAGWCALASRRIESLALVLQGKHAIPDLTALHPSLPRVELAAIQRCIRERPLLLPLVAAAAWVQGLIAGRMRKALSLILRRAGGFELILAEGSDVLYPTLRTIDLVLEDGESRTVALLNSLMDPRSYRIPHEPGTSGLSDLTSTVGTVLMNRAMWLDLLQRGGNEPPPAVTLESAPQSRPQRPWALTFAFSLANRDEAFRRKAVRLFGLLRPGALAGRWERWYAAYLRLRMEARRILGSPTSHASNRALAKVHAALRRLQSREPPCFAAVPLLDAMLSWSGGDLSELHFSLVKVLARIPPLFGPFTLRLDFFLHPRSPVVPAPPPVRGALGRSADPSIHQAALGPPVGR